MCRCGVSCDYIYRKLSSAENDKKAMGFKLSVDMLFPEDESSYIGVREGDIIEDQSQVEA